jgi:hypothetical protein
MRGVRWPGPTAGSRSSASCGKSPGDGRPEIRSVSRSLRVVADEVGDDVCCRRRRHHPKAQMDLPGRGGAAVRQGSPSAQRGDAQPSGGPPRVLGQLSGGVRAPLPFHVVAWATEALDQVRREVSGTRLASGRTVPGPAISRVHAGRSGGTPTSSATGRSPSWLRSSRRTNRSIVPTC